MGIFCWEYFFPSQTITLMVRLSLHGIRFPSDVFFSIFAYMDTNENKPRFSIIITVGEDTSSLEGAVRSCLEQDFTDFEIIIVDSGERLGTQPLDKTWDDLRISVIPAPGALSSAARNAGLEHSRGDYVLFLDQTDEIQQMWLTKAAERIALSKADAVQCATVYEKNGLTGGVHLPNDALMGFHQRLLFDHTIPTASMIVKREICARFPTDKNQCGDWEFWIETLRGRTVDVLPEYYGHIAQLDIDEANKSQLAYQQERLQIMKRYYPEMRLSLRKLRQRLKIRSAEKRLEKN